MRRVPATYFIKNIGVFLRGAAEAAVVVTSHGRDNAVLLSAAEYRRLQAAASPPAMAPATMTRASDPLATTLSILSTSVRKPIAEDELIAAFKAKSKKKHIVDIFFSDIDDRLMSALVARGYLSWAQIAAAMKDRKGIDDEKASFVREMAGYAMDDSAVLRTPPSR
jgi:prevent-host-death family protein